MQETIEVQAPTPKGRPKQHQCRSIVHTDNDPLNTVLEKASDPCMCPTLEYHTRGVYLRAGGGGRHQRPSKNP